MRTLILGGTGFLGRHLAGALRAAGHELVLLSRGRSNPGLFPDVEHITAGRVNAVEALAGRTFDAIFDPSGYRPAVVRASARAAAAAGAHYVFVSTVSVYADPTRADADTPVWPLDGSEDGVDLTLSTYGRLKLACERAVDEVLPGRAQHVRAGLIVGPHDYDARFPWWLRRLARGGDVIAPGLPDAPVQLLDARDLAAWLVGCAERRVAGVFDAVGPAHRLRRAELLGTMREVTGGDARLVWVDDETLLRHRVTPAAELPFWVPAKLDAVFSRDPRRAVAEGLAFRPLDATVRDTWAWLEQGGWEREEAVRTNREIRVNAGLDEAREREILEATARLRAARPG